MTVTQEATRQSVVRLFESLEASGVRYAVMRNYENYPDFAHDVDLVVHSDDMASVSASLLELAEQYDWDLLLACDHWNGSRVRVHNIEVFRLYKLEAPEYLQVDCFHGFPLAGLPLLDEARLLTGCIRDERGFMRIAPVLEALIRMFQLAKVASLEGPDVEKVKRYRRQVLTYLAQDADHLGQVFEECFGTPADLAVSALQQEKMPLFSRLMEQLRRAFVWRFCLRRPWETLNMQGARAFDLWRNYMGSPCGAVVHVYAPDGPARQRLSAELDLLAEANLVYRWTADHADASSLSWRERRVLERGGLVIKWVASAEQADVRVSDATETDLLRQSLIGCLVRRHRILFERQAGLQGERSLP